MINVLLIAGCRDENLSTYDIDTTIQPFLQQYNLHPDNTLVIAGEATGIDTAGKVWSKVNGYKYIPFPANWTQFGNAAGPIRNSEMAKYATHAFFVWDGKSKGTKNMISKVPNVPQQIIYLNT